MIIHVNRFYEKTEDLCNIVKLLDFKPNKFGDEIFNFNLIHPGVADGFSAVVGQKVKLNKDLSGVFRKPNPFIHFEDFGPQTLWIGLVPLEETVFRTHKHTETGSTHVFSAAETPEKAQEFINTHCSDESRWETVALIKMSPGDLVLLKPWVWHSLGNSLTKVFHLETPVEDGDKV